MKMEINCKQLICAKYVHICIAQNVLPEGETKIKIPYNKH